jgi:Kef-type K+ transport system membrane component KefB
MKKILATLAVLTPAIASAQAITDVNSLTYKLTNIGNVVIEILIAVAVIYIIILAVRYIMAGENADARKEIGKGILWGIVGLFVILSIWGLVRILTNTFRTDTNAPTSQFPQINYPRQITP